MFYLINHNAVNPIVGEYDTVDAAALAAMLNHGINVDIIGDRSPCDVLQEMQTGRNSIMDNYEIVEEADYRYFTENQ